MYQTPPPLPVHVAKTPLPEEILQSSFKVFHIMDQHRSSSKDTTLVRNYGAFVDVAYQSTG